VPADHAAPYSLRRHAQRPAAAAFTHGCCRSAGRERAAERNCLLCGSGSHVIVPGFELTQLLGTDEILDNALNVSLTRKHADHIDFVTNLFYCNRRVN
jgi:hypothetical protein